jgi:carboxyl-terminal processing protease
VNKALKITNLMPDGPAAKAGVLKNDLIISLGGYIIGSSSMDEIIKRLKGRAGTSLKTVIEREIILTQ